MCDGGSIRAGSLQFKKRGRVGGAQRPCPLIRLVVSLSEAFSFVTVLLFLLFTPLKRATSASVLVVFSNITAVWIAFRGFFLSDCFCIFTFTPLQASSSGEFCFGSCGLAQHRSSLALQGGPSKACQLYVFRRLTGSFRPRPFSLSLSLSRSLSLSLLFLPNSCLGLALSRN